MPITLPNGTSSVLCLEFEGTPTEGDGSGAAAGGFSFLDGLIGSGQAVNNVLTIGGASGDAANGDSASVEIELVPIVCKPFTRGNANNDGRFDIADPIYTISALFRAGPAPACADAADSNDDGMVDSSDVVYSIDYLFRGGDAPVAPFTDNADCACDPTDEDDLGCDVDACAS